MKMKILTYSPCSIDLLSQSVHPFILKLKIVNLMRFYSGMTHRGYIDIRFQSSFPVIQKVGNVAIFVFA